MAAVVDDQTHNLPVANPEVSGAVMNDLGVP